MLTRRSLLLVASLLLVSLTGVSRQLDVRADVANLPGRLTDREFWALLTDFSEPDGFFRSDNLVSNEIFLQHVIPDLVRTARGERVYLGVGPEQNFTYIAALRPRMAFIVDIRRGNLLLHLMYKALFELSEDRAEFVARLFSRPRPAGLDLASSARDIFTAFAHVGSSESYYKENLAAIEDHLVRRRQFSLTRGDLEGLQYIYYAFFAHGPGIQYWSTFGRGTRNAPTYAGLMQADDGRGQTQSFLATEERFAFVKRMQSRNLLVPIVGNFSGPRALRAVARYLREREATVSAFYLSNVEQYLNREGTWYAFCGNAATLPFDHTSAFIRSVRAGRYSLGVGLESVLGSISAEVRTCDTRGW